MLLKYRIPELGEFIQVDPGRIAAQAITGMGFLGAGVILRYKESIRGLTTAASMWVVCAIGLTIGAGYYLFGSITAGITLLSLLGVKLLDGKLSKDWYKEIEITSADLENQFEKICGIADKYNLKIVNSSLKKDFEKKEITLRFQLRFRAVHPDRNMIKDISRLEGIKRVDLSYR